MRALFAAVHEFASGTSLHFAATQQFGRFRSEADIQRAAITEGLGVRAVVLFLAAQHRRDQRLEARCRGPCGGQLDAAGGTRTRRIWI